MSVFEPSLWAILTTGAELLGVISLFCLVCLSELLIPTPDDQNPWAQSRSPSDMMRQGWSVSLFQAAQQ